MNQAKSSLDPFTPPAHSMSVVRRLLVSVFALGWLASLAFHAPLAHAQNTGGAPNVLYFNGPQANAGPLASHPKEMHSEPNPGGIGSMTPDASFTGHHSPLATPPAEASSVDADSEELDLSDDNSDPTPPARRVASCTKNLNGSEIGITPLAQKEWSALAHAPSPCAARELILRATRVALLNASRELACPANSEPPALALLAARQPEIDEQARSEAILAKLDAQRSSSNTDSPSDSAVAAKPWWAQLLAPFFDPILDRFGHLQAFKMQGSILHDPLSDSDFNIPLEVMQRSQLGVPTFSEMAFARINQLCPTWNDIQAQAFAPTLSIVRVIGPKDGVGASFVVEVRGASGPFATDKARTLVPFEGSIDWTGADLAGWLSQPDLAKAHVSQLLPLIGSEAATHWAAGLAGEGVDVNEPQPTPKAPPRGATNTSLPSDPAAKAGPTPSSRPKNAEASELLF